ncbi:hypothetical protein, conserved [Leishmania tarentolae]|uniref:Uncharacterized protein n=1 Tax=Leishmania tarentolae TaxID=5689 RepID=A0A640KRJ0_LEITA|nr:hypothetical protein, conserved [Leishmania tarentolae]
MSAANERQTPLGAPPTASPYICLSIQCEGLYRVGAQPHSFASISEQSVYTRAAERMRFVTPPPNLLPSMSGGTIGSDVDPLLPHVCVSETASSPFPSIKRFEAARRAALELEKTQAKSHRWSSAEPAMKLDEGAAAVSALSSELAPSGSLLAQRTYCHDYEDHRRKEHMGATEATPHGDRAEQTVGSSLKGSPQSPSPSLQLIFPSPVLLRAVAQLVLTLQASTSTSAARFTLAQYRGVQLLPWRTSLHKKESLASSTSPLSPEAVVVSILPQVVADCVSSRAQEASGQFRSHLSASVEDKKNATLYVLTPTSVPPAPMVRRGVKREREEAQQGAKEEGTAWSAHSAAIVAGGVLCERLLTTTEASRTQTAPVHYAAVSADTFEGWVPHIEKTDSSLAPTSSTASCVPETFLYQEESAWITEGIFNPLFSLPWAPPSENGSGGPSTAQTTFLKTSSFLFLSFLVHRSWCAHVHLAVTQQMTAHRLLSKIEQHAGSPEMTVTEVHVTRLPPVQEVRRSPQYEWRSALVYRIHDKQAVGRTASSAMSPIEGSEGVCETAAAIGTTTKSLLHTPVLWWLTVLVVNRNAQLQWFTCNTSLAACAGADSAPTLWHNAHEDIREGSGTLDDLLQRL